MKKYTIHINLQFSNQGKLQDMCAQLGGESQNHVPTCILVYPFLSPMSSSELQQHVVSACVGIKPFPVYAQGVSGFQEKHVLLNIKVGNDEILLLHDCLYQGPLLPYLNLHYTYFPHILLTTLGDAAGFKSALSKGSGMLDGFEAEITKVNIASVGQDGSLSTEYEVNL